MSQFDPALFLDATTTEALVKRPPLPVGDYTAVIGELKTREWVGQTDPTKSGIAVDVPLTIDVPFETQQALGLDMPTLQVKDSLMLDLTPQGTIDWSIGKNGRLRKYREATGQNQKGVPFSMRQLTGNVVLVKLAHRDYKGELFEEVAGVAAKG